jgi:hypothetical protein
MKIELYHLYWNQVQKDFSFIVGVDRSITYPMKLFCVSQNRKKWEAVGGGWEEEVSPGIVRQAEYSELTPNQRRNLLVLWFERGHYYKNGV